MKISIIGASVLLISLSAFAQDGECVDGLCGTPDETGGGGGGGSLLLQKSDQGDTYEYADDYDEDGIEDMFDNCPWTFNPSQIDFDGDGVGLSCDLCPDVFDPDQDDSDWDNIGDACDDDLDGDGVANEQDNCLFTPNPERPQIDADGDGMGAVCDPDDNGDGIDDALETVSSLEETLRLGDNHEILPIEIDQFDDEDLPALDFEVENTGCSM